jgi:hypothetical protein
MARRYSRDNRGRFAGGGSSSGGGGKVGATARGGRLRTAAGNKRATQTTKAAPAKLSGTMAGKVKRNPTAASKIGAAKPAKSKRVLVKANARPENLFSRATKSTPGYGTDAKANVANARKTAEAAGAKTAVKSNKRSSVVAGVSSKTPNQVDFNASHPSWANPRQSAIKDRRRNLFSTAKAGHTVQHELGHIRHSPMKMANSFETQLRKKGQLYADADKIVGTQRLARRVSQYARTSPAEFTAETKAALSLGKKYDNKVMGLYREITGERLPSVKSQQRQQGVTGSYVSPRAKRKPKKK